LLIDDGSKDNSGAICDEYTVKDSRVRVFHKENGGVSSARNLGLDNAVGEWIAWVDSDDYIAPNMFEHLFKAAETNEADIVYCNFYMDCGDEIKRYCLSPSSDDKHVMLKEWISEVWTVLWTSLTKRSLYENNNLRFSTDFNFCEDFWMSLELRLSSKRVVSLNDAYYFYNRSNEVSITQRQELLLDDKKNAYYAIFSSLKHKGLFDEYKKYLYWRILKSHQHWLVDKNMFNNYLTFIPESIEELWSCPGLNFRQKIMIWCITHNLKFVVELKLLTHKIKKRYCR
jgi:glycosyltransferase involved in cell wall biosynthesis